MNMTHCQAMKVLDAVRDGQPFPLHVINQALELTGDLDEKCNYDAQPQNNI